MAGNTIDFDTDLLMTWCEEEVATEIDKLPEQEKIQPTLNMSDVVDLVGL